MSSLADDVDSFESETTQETPTLVATHQQLIDRYRDDPALPTPKTPLTTTTSMRRPQKPALPRSMLVQDAD